MMMHTEQPNSNPTGIMTLTRAPCELDKMSLFQDLKLKRRKVDSRCSSDGESVADTSTSSPDLVSPSSPKMMDAATGGGAATTATGAASFTPTNNNNNNNNHHQHQQNNPSPPSPDSTPVHHPPEPTLDKISSRLEDSGVFDGGGGSSNGGGSSTSVIRSLPRAHSPPPVLLRPASPQQQQPPRPHSSPGRPPNTSPVIIHNPMVVAQQQQQQASGNCSPSANKLVGMKQEPTSSSPSPMPPNNRGVIISHPTSLPQSQLWLKHSTRINGVKPELIGGNFGGAAAVAALGHFSDMSKSPGGPISPLGRTPSVAAPVRQTPTVIMGEAGGVRTMIWSQPQGMCTTATSAPIVDIAAVAAAATAAMSNASSSNWGGGIVNTDESAAAQMLLNLGQVQDRLRPPSVPRTLQVSPQSPSSHFTNTPLNMERLWAGDLRQLPANQQTHALNLTSPSPPGCIPGLYQDVKIPPGLLSNDSSSETSVVHHHEGVDEEEQPMICMICEDKATGLHYGIITCEGCKGFFKRTVQNRRVYTCVADGNCEITKAQRNRCQYCRFKKCIEQGMVLQAVREDRMPGGRNSGAVYNLYKVKYKKHKKPASKQQSHQPKQQQQQTLLHQEKSIQHHQQFKTEQPQQQPQQQQQQQQPSSIPANLVNGTILKTALTNPSEVVRLRQRLDSAVSSSRDRNFSIEYSLSMIKTLIDCDEFRDIAILQNMDDLLDHSTDLSEKLCHIGDSIVYKLVQWTKRLPFYLELPVEVHTRLLTHKWHELLVLTTSAYQAIHKAGDEPVTSVIIKTDFNHEVETNLCTLQNCLTSMMGREITLDQLRSDVGQMIEKITHVTLMFRQLKLNMEEYVCLKVITMLSQTKPATSGNNELDTINERYMTCLRVYTQHMYPQQTTRFQDLLARLPEIQSAAALLLESKMFYVPFLLNSAIHR